jgi:hypothetical protein
MASIAEDLAGVRTIRRTLRLLVAMVAALLVIAGVAAGIAIIEFERIGALSTAPAPTNTNTWSNTTKFVNTTKTIIEPMPTWENLTLYVNKTVYVPIWYNRTVYANTTFNNTEYVFENTTVWENQTYYSNASVPLVAVFACTYDGGETITCVPNVSGGVPPYVLFSWHWNDDNYTNLTSPAPVTYTYHGNDTWQSLTVTDSIGDTCTYSYAYDP